MSANLLAELLDDLTDFAEGCEVDYHAATDLDRDARATLMCAVRDCRADLATLLSVIEADLLTEAGERRFVVPGIGEVEVRRANKRSGWDNEGLTRKVVALALDERVLDETSGEYEPAHEAVARVLSECARPSWRVTPLRARGIQVDEFCSEEQGAYSVQLPPRVVTP